MLDTSITSEWVETLRREEDHQARMLLELAADLAGTPLALISLRNARHLKRWVSLDDSIPDTLPLHDSLCGLAVIKGRPLVTRDAYQHAELRDTCSVKGMAYASISDCHCMMPLALWSDA